jgi:hypothetical protein
LSKYILRNMLSNYQGIISRKTYQSLEIGFAQRLFSLYQYRSQFGGQKNCVDFELMDLATILPMSGKLYPSIVKDRLKNPLKELSDRKILKHEYIKALNKTILRLTPFHLEKEHLNSISSAQRFLNLCRDVYKTDLLSEFDLNEEGFLSILKKYAREIECQGGKYLWAIHVFDVVGFMMLKQTYQVKSPQAFLHSMLQKAEIDYPIGFKPVDLAFEEIQSKKDVESAVSYQDEAIKCAEDELFRMALRYVDFLKTGAKEEYLEKAREKNPLMNDSMLKFEIAELIQEDMKLGVNITDLLDDQKLSQARSNAPIPISGPGNA